MPDVKSPSSQPKNGPIEINTRKPAWHGILKLLGLAQEAEVVVTKVVEQPAPTERPSPPCTFDASKPIPPLDPNRFAESCDLAARQIKLDSQRIKGQ
jgi:hypothetical protein